MTYYEMSVKVNRNFEKPFSYLLKKILGENVEICKIPRQKIQTLLQKSKKK